MIKFAWKNLTEEGMRLAISVGGVALAMVLILVMQGVFAGSEEHAVSYMRHQPAELWVMQDGVENLHMATSILPPTALDSVRGAEGVDQAVGVLYANVGVDVGDTTVFSYVFGVEPEAPFGGPWSIVRGRIPKSSEDIVLDRVLATRYGLSLGDRVKILDQELEISGLTEGNFGIATSLVFVNKETLASMMGVPASFSSYILVRPDAAANQRDVMANLASLEGVNVMQRDELIASDQTMIRQMGVDVLKAMNSVAYVVGMLVIGLTLYTATLERRREYGILRAVGGSRRHLWSVVLAQAAITALLGIALGIGLSYGAAWGISAALPEMLVVIRTQSVLAVVGALFAVSVVAALLPAVEVGRVDPMLVFKT